MLSQFRISYPKGCLISELLTIDHGKYVVRALVEVEGLTLATGLAAADTVENAEDQARARALAVLGILATAETGQEQTKLIPADLTATPTPTPTPQIPFIEEKLAQPAQSSEVTTFPQVDSEDISTSKLNFSSNNTSHTGISVEQSNDLLNDDFSNIDVEASTKENTPLSTPTVLPLTNTDNPTSSLSSGDDYPQVELVADVSSTPLTSGVIDFSEMVARSNIELKRLGWTKQRGVDYLLAKYNKKIRSELTDKELKEFLNYLELQPTPDDEA
ncbi:MAG TPA: hypothetical protein V6D15_23185 [Oculatellaceae cyanobacterium]